MELDKIIIKYGADLAELKADMAELKKTTTGFEQSATTSAKKVEESLNSVGSTVNTKLSTAFKNLAGTIAAAFAVERIGAFISSSIQLAAEAQEVRAEFEKLNNPLLLSNLRKATGGTLSDLKLMGIALRADKLQIPLEKLTKILEFAKLRGDALGKSTEELAESLIQGIGIKGTRALVQVGISQEQFSAEVKKTGDYFTALDNIMTETLDNAGDGFESVADKQEKLRANIENLKIEIGERLLPVINNLLTGVLKVTDAFDILFNSKERRTDAIYESIAKSGLGIEALTEQLNKNKLEIDDILTRYPNIENINRQMLALMDKGATSERDRIDSLKLQNEAISEYIKVLQNTKTTQEDVTESVDTNTNSVKENAEQVWGLGSALLFLAKHAMDAQVAVGDHLVGGIGRAREAFGSARTEAEKLREELERLPDSTEESLDKSVDMWDEYAHTLLSLFDSFNTAYTNSSNYRLSVLEKELENGQISQETYDKKKKQILRGEAQREKAFSVLSITLATARAIMNALGSLPPSPALAILAGITGAAQLGVAISAPIPAFKTGVIDFKGKGTETSDSNLVRISHGESVINAKATRKHRDLLEAINKDNLDKYLNNKYGGKDTEISWDDYRLLLAIQKDTYQSKENTHRLIQAIKEQRKPHRF